MIEYDIKYMRRALELAARGRGFTSPNPMVGAVIVAPDGRIIGEGWHRICGSGHAEVNAIASVSDTDRPLLRQAAMYVTLEPCSHWGKTPPCARLIIDTGIPRVIVGAGDPFREVAGRGIAMLRDAGVEVAEGVLAAESRSLNARFITAHEQHRPWVTLKWAQSADGFMDSNRPDGHAERFSCTLSSTLCHRLRSFHDAIAVGSATAIADSPRLDCRLWPGRSPRPVIFDRSGSISPAGASTAVEPLIAAESTVAEALAALYGRGITSLMVEGGPRLLRSFIDAGLWDVAQVEVASRHLGPHGRAAAPSLPGSPVATLQLEASRLDFYSNNHLFCVKNL